MGFGVWGLGFGVWGLGFGVWDLGNWLYNLHLQDDEREDGAADEGEACADVAADEGGMGAEGEREGGGGGARAVPCFVGCTLPAATLLQFCSAMQRGLMPEGLEVHDVGICVT